MSEHVLLAPNARTGRRRPGLYAFARPLRRGCVNEEEKNEHEDRPQLQAGYFMCRKRKGERGNDRRRRR